MRGEYPCISIKILGVRLYISTLYGDPPGYGQPWSSFTQLLYRICFHLGGTHWVWRESPKWERSVSPSTKRLANKLGQNSLMRVVSGAPHGQGEPNAANDHQNHVSTFFCRHFCCWIEDFVTPGPRRKTWATWATCHMRFFRVWGETKPDAGMQFLETGYFAKTCMTCAMS